MATPWCEFCAVEMLIFIDGLRQAAPAMPKPRTRPSGQSVQFHWYLLWGIGKKMRRGGRKRTVDYARIGSFTASGFSRT